MEILAPCWLLAERRRIHASAATGGGDKFGRRGEEALGRCLRRGLSQRGSTSSSKVVSLSVRVPPFLVVLPPFVLGTLIYRSFILRFWPLYQPPSFDYSVHSLPSRIVSVTFISFLYLRSPHPLPIADNILGQEFIAPAKKTTPTHRPRPSLVWIALTPNVFGEWLRLIDPNQWGRCCMRRPGRSSAGVAFATPLRVPSHGRSASPAPASGQGKGFGHPSRLPNAPTGRMEMLSRVRSRWSGRGLSMWRDRS